MQKITPIQVLQEGVLIPKHYLENASEFEIVVTADYVLVKPKVAATISKHVNGKPVNGHSVKPAKNTPRNQTSGQDVLRAGFPERTLLTAEEQQQRIDAVKASTDWAAMTEREQAIAVLRAGGMLREYSREEQQQALECDVTLEQVQADLSRVDGPLLSDFIIEMRGPKG